MHMLFQGPGHKHWISEDYGKTYTAVDTPGGTLGYGRWAMSTCVTDARFGMVPQLSCSLGEAFGVNPALQRDQDPPNAAGLGAGTCAPQRVPVGEPSVLVKWSAAWRLF